MRIRRLALAAALTGSAAFAQTAHAGGYLTSRFGATEGNVTSSHVSAAYYNPAGLAFGHGWRLSLEGSFGYRTASFDRDPAGIDNVLQPGDTGPGTPAADVRYNSGKNTLTNLVTSPFFGVATDFGLPNLGVALTVSVPFGGQAEWGQDDSLAGNPSYPGAIDGSQRWATISGSIRSLYITGAGAYYVPSLKLSFGLGLNVIMQSVDTIRARTPSGEDDLVVQPTGALAEGRTVVTADGTTFSLAGGLMWLPIPELRVGLSYQGQPGFGKHRLDGTLTNKYGSGGTASGPIEFEQNLPDIVRIGAAYQLTPELALRISADWQRWSVFENQCLLDATVADAECDLNADGSLGANAKGVVVAVPRYWHDSYDVTVGGTYVFSPTITFDASLGVNTSAVPDRTLDASFIDMMKVIPVIGGRFVLTDNIALAAHYTQVIYLPREAGVEANYEAPSRAPSQAGKYTQSIGLLQVEAQVTF